MPTGIYLHIPFCRIKCPYCDFNTYAGIQDQRPRYMEALKAELRRRLEETQPQPFSPQTVYFGGGTPSLLPPDEIAALLEAVQQHGKPVAPMEVTLEVNPGTVDRARLAAFREAGVNRITIGAQSFQPELLSSLGRLHDVEQTLSVLADVRDVGFEQLNVDLMFGLSGQTLEDWRADLQTAFSQRPTHLSLYNLTIEQGTPFAKQHVQGRLQLPDEESQRAMYVEALRACEQEGLRRYEVSNFARPGAECLHNRLYWDGEPWLGVGAGAHGFAPADGVQHHGRRWWNLKVPRLYSEAVEAGRLPEEGSEDLHREAAMTEALLLGLRTREGLDLQYFEERFGVDLRPLCAPLLGPEHLAVEGERLFATEDGVIILDFLIESLSRKLDRAHRFDTVKNTGEGACEARGAREVPPSPLDRA